MKLLSVLALAASLPALAQKPISHPAQDWIRNLQGVLPDGQYRGVTRSGRDCEVRISSGGGGYIAAIGFSGRKQIEFLLPPSGVRLYGSWDHPKPTYERGRMIAVGAEFYGMTREMIRRAIVISMRYNRVHVEIESESDELRRVPCILDANIVPGFRHFAKR